MGGTTAAAERQQPEKITADKLEAAVVLLTFRYNESGEELTTVLRPGQGRKWCDFEAGEWRDFPEEWESLGVFLPSPYTPADLEVDQGQEEVERANRRAEESSKAEQELRVQMAEREAQLGRQLAEWKATAEKLEREIVELTKRQAAKNKEYEKKLQTMEDFGDSSTWASTTHLQAEIDQLTREAAERSRASKDYAAKLEAKIARLEAELAQGGGSASSKSKDGPAPASSSGAGPAAASPPSSSEDTSKLKRELEEALEEAAYATKELNQVRLERDQLAKDLQDSLEKARVEGSQNALRVAKLQAFSGTVQEALVASQVLSRKVGHLGRDLVDQVRANDREVMAVARGAIQRLHQVSEGYLVKYQAATKERKALFNQLQELRGNIRVFCRCRGLNARELQEGKVIDACTFPASDEIAVADKHGGAQGFEFDKVFGPSATQEDVFADVQPFVISCVDGYNVCVFAYGQTGAGKTFTMMGTAEKQGVNLRALNELFLETSRRDLETFDVSCSFLEIYNEKIKDLLNPSDAKLEVRQNEAGVPHVPGLESVPVRSLEDVVKVIERGEKMRTTKSTAMNEVSSRSHSLLIVRVTATVPSTGATRTSMLTLIDLAGSERISKSEATGDRLLEAQAINKSLATLGNVLSGLQAKQSHVPYRDSTLTRLLQPSLGGNSKVLMFVNVSPLASNTDETICTLKFGDRARKTELGKVKKQEALVGGGAGGGAGGGGGGAKLPGLAGKGKK